MRKILLGLLISMSTAAAAEPQWRVHVWGSGADIIASNPDDVPYNCSYSYGYSHTDFGETKTGTNSGTFYIRARSGEIIGSHWQTGWSNFVITDGPDVHCTRAN
jgi:hypothetical protein